MSYVRSAMLYGSETWCLRENKVAILRRVTRSMVRAMQIWWTRGIQRSRWTCWD